MKTLHKQCEGLDVQRAEVVACLRVVNRKKASYAVGRFPTTTRRLRLTRRARPAISEERGRGSRPSHICALILHGAAIGGMALHKVPLILRTEAPFALARLQLRISAFWMGLCFDARNEFSSATRSHQPQDFDASRYAGRSRGASLEGCAVAQRLPRPRRQSISSSLCPW